MLQQSMRNLYQALSARNEAGQRCMETLLNCYCREVAGPEEQLGFGPVFGQNDWPLPLRSAAGRGGLVMQVLLPHIHSRILVAVDAASPTANYHYASLAYYKLPERGWALLDWQILAGLLLEELRLKYDTPFNQELLEQIGDSVNVTAAILMASPPPQWEASPPLQSWRAYIESEQSLTYGHPFHPAPKSRQGFSVEDVPRYSPELGARFPLHYFAVRREYLLQKSLLAGSADELVNRQAPQELQTDASFALIPAHPWQAEQLLAHPVVQQALRQDILRDLGPQGPAYYPTSSIRTLFHPQNPYFYKCSLNVRITNCVRKNTRYELEGALQITRIVREIMPDLAERFPPLRIMEEPAYLSVVLPSSNPEHSRDVPASFGMILRQGFAGLLDEHVTPVLAGALFGNHVIGQARLHSLLQEAAAQGCASAAGAGCAGAAAAHSGHRLEETLDEIRERWFTAYVEQLLPPVLYCYFVHGVIFEPHLQNVLIGLKKGWPVQIFLRDFEGVKLVNTRFSPERLGEADLRTRESLMYSEGQGWNRISYCLFVNHLCEAIVHLSGGDPRMQGQLWAIVRDQLCRFRTHYGDTYGAHRIDTLLSGQSLPAKANLINRFFKRPDRSATYLPLPNPLALVP